MDGKTCEACRVTYYQGLRRQKEYEKSKYCSLKCVWEARQAAAIQRRTALVKQCRECGKSFSLYDSPSRTKPAFEATKYCSKECSNHGAQRTIDGLYSQIKIDQLTGCHVWTGKLYDGYGRARFKRYRQLVHRIIWEHTHGPVPEGLQIDHLCKNRACCNTDHLRVVTGKVNVLASNCPAALNARKDCCSKCGGEFSRKRNGNRYCLPCSTTYAREYVRRRSLEDPEYRRHRNEVQQQRFRIRYANDPEFRAARRAIHERSQAKLKGEKK
jgi:HNH endonuclease